MLSYYIAASKRFYEIAILSCICDPISVVRSPLPRRSYRRAYCIESSQAVEGVAERLPEPMSIRRPDFVPSLEECVEKLPSYEKTRSFVKRIVHLITPVSLPEKFNSLMETRLY